MDVIQHASSLTAVDGIPVAGTAELRCRVGELEAQVAQLSEALANRPAIEHVVGMLMLLMSCGPDTAWATLARVSQTTNRKVRDIAAAVADQVARGEGLPPDVVAALRDVLPPPHR